MRYAQIVLGLKGNGKSTYCKLASKYGESRGRKIKVVNLDPTVESLPYVPTVDIRSQITSEEYTEADKNGHLAVGGGLEHVLKYIVEHQEWLFGAIEEMEGDHFLFDCPGDSDFCPYLNIIKVFGAMLLVKNIRVCMVFIRDARLATNGYSYISSCLSPLVSQVTLSLPHVNVMMKIDMLSNDDKSRLLLFINSDIKDVLRYENGKRETVDRKLAQAAEIASILLDGHNLMRRKYFLLDIREESHIRGISALIDENLGVPVEA